MAGDAFSGKACELAGGGPFVAGVAAHRGVRADQRKAVLVVANGGKRHLPTLHRVALFTLCSKLAPVNVSVAITAFGGNVRENQADMTLRAGHSFMESPQRVGCLAVIEFQYVAQWFPSGEGVAIRTGECSFAVRAVCSRARRILPSGQIPSRQQCESNQQAQTQSDGHGSLRP